jgi:phage gp29-like protein
MPVLDLYGRPMESVPEAELLERQAVASLGSVRQIQSGHPADGLTPRHLASILRAAEMGDATAYLELAEQMEEKDLHYAAVLGVRKRAIRSLATQVEPGDDSEAAHEAAEMVRKTLSAAPVKTALIDVMDALGKSYSVCEIGWEREGRNLNVAALDYVDPRWFEFDQENGRYLYLRDNDGPQPLRLNSYVIHMAKIKSGLPIRSGLARLAVWAYIFKNYTLKDWSIFCEAYGHPLRLGKYDTSATPADRQTLLKAVRQIGVDMAAVIPKSMEVEIVAAAAAGADKLYEGNARFWDEQLSKGVLGQVATTDAIAGGHAVGKIHEEVRSDIRDADAEQLAATLQRDLAGPIVRLNFDPRHNVPVPIISFVPPERADPDLLLKLMDKAPKLGLRIATSDVYTAFNLREPDADEEVLAVPVSENVDDKKTERQAASRMDDRSPKDSIEALVDELISDGDLQAIMNDELGELLSLLSGAVDMEQVRDILDVFADSSESSALLEHLSQSSLAARLAGETGAAVTSS